MDYIGREGGAFRRASTVAMDYSKPAEERIQEFKLKDGPEGDNKMLRLSVEGCGYSGFLYNFALDVKVNKDDRVFERDGVDVVDEISFRFIEGATVDFFEELI